MPSITEGQTIQGQTIHWPKKGQRDEHKDLQNTTQTIKH